MIRTLRARNLVKTYKGRRVVDEVSFSMTNRDIVGLLGPNGAGKTTTFYMTVGLTRSDSGTVSLDDQDITLMPMYQRARVGIGYLPQEPSVFRKLSVLENITAILETLPYTRYERNQKANELLAELGILHLSKNLALSLSGGERRRLEIARALSTRPSFILL
ncbi:Lipopolysaccharide ABC transporter, ATP-binding protein LptB, partial [hydrothermal vent metagenome]